MTPQEFFTKNMKWIVMILAFLFIVKTIQSCNREMVITTKDNEIIHLQDSLSSMYGTEKEDLLLQLNDCKDEKVQLEYEVRLANSQRDEANKRADAVQSTAEKTRSNTTSTIVVKGAEKVVDTSEIKE